MIYLVGVNHQVQFENEYSDMEIISNFKSHLIDLIYENKIKFIGEEFSMEALEKNNAKISVAENVAIEMNITHRYCDPETEERKNIGYPTRQEITEKLKLPKIQKIQDYAIQYKKN